MCNQCGSENGSTYHLLYWQAEWIKRFLTTWYHIIYRPAYWKWAKKNCKSYKKNQIMASVYEKTDDLNPSDIDDHIMQQYFKDVYGINHDIKT